jgi:hypothetical protein
VIRIGDELEPSAHASQRREGMPAQQLPKTDRLLDFVLLCRDEQAPCPVPTRVFTAQTGLSMYQVRAAASSLRDGRLTTM